MKHLFIVNPVAGKGKGLEYMEAIKPLLEGKIQYKIEVTKGKGHATELARYYTSKEDYIIYAVGGDGTINEVINGMAGSCSALAIVPAGSGNDLIRTLYPDSAIREELLYKLLKGTLQPIDLVKMNNRYFLNIASVGIDAKVAYNVSYFKKFKYIRGEMAYLLSIFRTLIGYKTDQLRVKVNDQEVWNGQVLLLAIANGKYYGGGVPIAPSAYIDDGKINIYLVGKLNLFRILKIIPKLFKAKHEDLTEITLYKSQSISIEGKEAFLVNIDGEMLESTYVEIEVIPRGIQVVLPA